MTRDRVGSHPGECRFIKAKGSYFKRESTVNFVERCCRVRENDDYSVSIGFSNMKVLMVFTKRNFNRVNGMEARWGGLKSDW